jgi:hypothetical protein
VNNRGLNQCSVVHHHALMLSVLFKLISVGHQLQNKSAYEGCKNQVFILVLKLATLSRNK